jgi:hypothetical protein
MVLLNFIACDLKAELAPSFFLEHFLNESEESFLAFELKL